MPSYAVIGASRGIGVSRFPYCQIEACELTPFHQLGFVKKLSADPQNTVFALVRNPDNSPGLVDFVESSQSNHGNVRILKLDLEDSASILVRSTQVARS